MQDVVITIKGQQHTDDWENFDGPIELITPGKLLTHPGGYALTYKESRLTGMDGTETTLNVESKRVTLTRTGGVFSEMIFEQGLRHLSYRDHGDYGFPSLAGGAEGAVVGVNACKVKTTFDGQGGVIDVEYALDIENRLSGHSKMEIEFRRVH